MVAFKVQGLRAEQDGWIDYTESDGRNGGRSVGQITQTR